MSKRGWEDHEAFIQGLFGLRGTVCSGNKWYDPGDAVDGQHPTDSPFPIFADCKYTEAASYSVKAKEMAQWSTRAEEMGKRFILPIRLWPKGAASPQDWVVLNVHDFAELLEAYRGL